jgi:hypothetical protein
MLLAHASPPTNAISSPDKLIGSPDKLEAEVS